MKRFMVVLALFMVFCFSFVNASAAYATVTADWLRLHKTPQGDVVGKVKYGTLLELLEGPDRDGYYKVSYKENVYYVYGSYLDFSNSEVPSSQQKQAKTKAKYFLFTEEIEPKALMFVNAKKAVSLRKYAEPYSLRLGWVDRGEPVILVSTRVTKNGFVKVATLDGTVEGYTFFKYLSYKPIKGFDYSDFEEVKVKDEGIVTWTMRGDG